MSAPLVSVIVPAYNAQAYIRECLDSILGMAHADFELIIVDDGSTDSTPEILAEYSAKDPRIKVLTQPNAGPSAARNRGIDAARGKWIAFVDADDTVHPNYLSLLLSMAVEGVDVAAVDYCRGKEPRWSTSTQAILFPSGRAALYDMLYQRCINSCPYSKLFSRKLFDKIRFKEGIIYEDLEVLSRIFMQCGEVAYAPHKIYFYRDNPTSFINTFTPARLDVLKVTQGIYDMCRGIPTLEAAAADRQFAANCNIFLLASAASKENWAKAAATTNDPKALISTAQAKAAASTNDPKALISTAQAKAAADECWAQIKRLRWRTIANPHSRIKNLAGALLSLLGRRLFSLAAPKP